MEQILDLLSDGGHCHLCLEPLERGDRVIRLPVFVRFSEAGPKAGTLASIRIHVECRQGEDVH